MDGVSLVIFGRRGLAPRGAFVASTALKALADFGHGMGGIELQGFSLFDCWPCCSLIERLPAQDWQRRVSHLPRSAMPLSDAPVPAARPVAMLDRSAADAAAHAGDPDFMTSLARGLAVLMAFDDQQRAVTCAQLSHRTGLSRAAVRRCLHTLVLLGFASCEDGKHYRLTPKVLALGHAYLSSSPLVALAPGVLERLAARTGESASVATLEGREIAYVARSHGSDRIMSINLNVGSRLPAYCTSLGRVLLAALPPEKLDAYLAEAQPLRRTARTIATVTELRDAIRLAGEQGYAVNDQELEVGLRSIAVPVRDRRGRVVAAMNVGTLSSRRSIAEMEGRLLPVLREAAEELGRMLA